MEKSIKKEDLTLEVSLLKALSNRDEYVTYCHTLDKKRLLPNSKVLLEDYEKYFVLYPETTDIDWNVFQTHFSQDWHSKDMQVEDIEYYREYVFPTVRDSRIENTDKIILALAKKKYAEEIEKCVHNEFDVSKLRDIIDNYEKKASKILGDFDKDAHTIETEDFDVLDKSQGIPWFLPQLQQNLMSITQGQFIVVSADYGTGKSAFVVSQAVHSFKYMSKKEHKSPILYFNSEGTAADVLARFLSNLYKDKVAGGFEEIVERRLEIKEKFIKYFDSDLFKVFQMSDVSSFYAVQQKIKKYKPAIAFIDICDKLAPTEDVQQLKKLYDDLRVLSAAECPIIGTSQSGNTSYQDKETNEIKNRKWLSDHDLYGSKAGKGGASDTLIMIGREDDRSNLRYISTPKKKRGKPVNIVCEIEEIYSNYKELSF
jgi:replicative DNA helicase